MYVNELTGTIPTEVGNMKVLQELYWHKNGLTGTIPTEVGNLQHLSLLMLPMNHLTRSIPTEIGKLDMLTQLYLNSNDLTGPIPIEIGNLANLTDLYFSFNALNGTIPTEVGIMQKLETLFLNGNRLTGTVPTEIGSLDLLRNLNIEKNDFTGTFPTEFINVKQFQILELGNNFHKTITKMCATKPLLTPFNPFNNSIYDDRIAQLLQFLHHLSSVKVLQDPESPQYKAACFILYDDHLTMTVASNKYLIERYALFVLFYSINWFGDEEVYSQPSCEYNGIDCFDDGYIMTINTRYTRNTIRTGTIPTEIGYFENLSEF